jgi:hypothetical protein
LRNLTLKEPLRYVDSWGHLLSARIVVPHDLAATFRTLEQFLLSIGEECPELEALHILPASSCEKDCLPLGDYEAACTQLIRKCPRLGVLDPLIIDLRDLETPCDHDVSTWVGTNLSSVTLSYSSKDALADMLLGLCSLSSLRELKVVLFDSLLGEMENPAVQTAFEDFALSSPSELSSLELVQTPIEKSAVHMILAHCTKLRKLNLDHVKFDGEWEGDFHIGHEIGLPEFGSKSIRVLLWRQELMRRRGKANQVRLGVFS